MIVSLTHLVELQDLVGPDVQQDDHSFSSSVAFGSQYLFILLSPSIANYLVYSPLISKYRTRVTSTRDREGV